MKDSSPIEPRPEEQSCDVLKHAENHIWAEDYSVGNEDFIRKIHPVACLGKSDVDGSESIALCKGGVGGSTLHMDGHGSMLLEDGVISATLQQ